jgi:hypothetical protein
VRLRPVIFVALHSVEQREKCAALLKAVDYAVYDLKGQGVDGVPSIDEIYALPVNGAA